MLHALLNRLARRPAVQPGRVLTRRGGPGRLGRELFISYVESSGGLPPRRLDRHDAALRRRRVARRCAIAGLTALGVWVAIESAHALAMF
jgi:hypothetical protein